MCFSSTQVWDFRWKHLIFIEGPFRCYVPHYSKLLAITDVITDSSFLFKENVGQFLVDFWHTITKFFLLAGRRKKSGCEHISIRIACQKIYSKVQFISTIISKVESNLTIISPSLACFFQWRTFQYVEWWPIWEKNLKKSGYMYMYNWFTLLYSRKLTQHCISNIV